MSDAVEEIEKDDDKKSPDKWDIENWTRTVIEAEEIKADPEKMKYVGPAIEKKRAALEKAAPIKSLDDLKKKANKME